MIENDLKILKEFAKESAHEKSREEERLLREYIRELTLHTSSARSYVHDSGLIGQVSWPDQKKIDEDWNLMCSYVNHSYILSESSRQRAQMLCESFMEKTIAMAKSVGAKVTSWSDIVAAKGKELGASAVEKLKRLKDAAAKVLMKIIESIPGGKTVYEFVTWAGGKLVDKLKEIGNAIGDKIKEWFKTAKQKLVDIVVNVVFKGDPKFRKDLYAAMGITEEQVCHAQMECKRLGINSVDLLNEWIEAGRNQITESRFRKKRLRLLHEQEKDKNKEPEGNCAGTGGATAEEIKTAQLAIDKSLDIEGGEEEIQDAAKTLGFLGPDGSSQEVNPEKLVRGRAGKIIDEIMQIWANLAKKNPDEYIKPLAEKDFWEPFKTGYGLAGSALMGLLSLSDSAWETMVMYIDKIKEGLEIKGKEAMDDKEMMQTKSGSFFANPTTLGPFLKGIIEGSNVEVLIRVFMGDPTQAVEAGKRVVNMIVTAIRSKIKERKKEIEDYAEKEAQTAGQDAIIGDETKAAATAADKEAAAAFDDTMDDLLSFDF